MDTREYALMRQVEDHHWWFTGKHRLVANLLRAHLPKAPSGGRTLLDVGAGTGRVMELLSAFGAAYGCDLSPDALRFCRERGLAVARADAARLPFVPGGFDAVTLLDVIYHRGVADDVAVLREVRQVLKPGGLLVLTESAHQWLYSRHDVAVHARQRYGKRELGEKLERAGFRVARLGYATCLLFPVALAVRLAGKVAGRLAGGEAASDVTMPSAPMNAALSAITRFEADLLPRLHLPVGLGLYAVAAKPE